MPAGRRSAHLFGVSARSNSVRALIDNIADEDPVHQQSSEIPESTFSFSAKAALAFARLSLDEVLINVISL